MSYSLMKSSNFFRTWDLFFQYGIFHIIHGYSKNKAYDHLNHPVLSNNRLDGCEIMAEYKY